MATMGFLSLTDDKDKEEFENNALLEKGKEKLPKYMQFKKAYCITLADLNAELKKKPNALEWEEYRRWMREVVSFPEQLTTREIGKSDKVTARMAIWLAFYRMGLPNSKIDKNHILTEKQWAEQGRTAWKYASRVEVPVLKSTGTSLNSGSGSSSWWLAAKLIRVPLKGRIPTVDLVHRWQTFPTIPPESAADPMKLEREECLKHVLRFHGKQGGLTLDDLKDGASSWEIEAIEKFALKMNLEGEEDSSESLSLGATGDVQMLEGYMKRRVATGWKKYFYCVSGGDNVPGMLSEFKSEAMGAQPRTAIFLQDCTVLECKRMPNGSPAKPYTIELSRRNKSSLHLRCKSEEEMNQWISVLVSYSNILNVNLDLSQIQQAALSCNEKGKVVDINVLFTELTGYTRPNVVSKNIKILMPPEHQKPHAKYMSDYCKRGTSKIIGSTRMLPVVLASGETQNMLITIGEFFHKKQRKFFATFADPATRSSIGASSLRTGGGSEWAATADDLSDPSTETETDGPASSSGWVSSTAQSS